MTNTELLAAIDEFDRRVTVLEAADASDPRTWQAAHAIADEIRATSPHPGDGTLVDYSDDLDALVTRAEAVDLSPSYFDLFTTLDELEASGADARSFKQQVEALLFSERSKAPQDTRAIGKLEHMVRRAVALSG